MRVNLTCGRYKAIIVEDAGSYMNFCLEKHHRIRCLRRVGHQLVVSMRSRRARVSLKVVKKQVERGSCPGEKRQCLICSKKTFGCSRVGIKRASRLQHECGRSCKKAPENHPCGLSSASRPRCSVMEAIQHLGRALSLGAQDLRNVNGAAVAFYNTGLVGESSSRY